MKPKLSLIICSRDRAEQLKKCLASINVGEMREVNGELILVNNASMDGTDEVMQSFKKTTSSPVKIINEPKPGLGRAKNAGISIAGGELLIFIDDDCYLADGYLKKATQIFESGEFQYCGSRVILHDPTDAMFSVNYINHRVTIPPGNIVYPGQIPGSGMIIHQKVVDKIGLFDPMFGTGTPFSPDDVDYATRASLAGFTGAFIPELVVYHHHRRKPEDVENLINYYVQGMGALSMKLILVEKRDGLKWLTESLRGLKNFLMENSLKQPPFLFARAISGGLHYLFARSRELLSRRDFRVVGMMSVYNEADIVEQTLEYGINQGIEFVILDNGSTDGSYEICRKFLGKGVLRIEKYETENFALDTILEKLYEMSLSSKPDWLILWDADAFLEPPFRNMALKDAVKKVDSENYDCIRFDNFEFWPTEEDNDSDDVQERIKYYTWNDDHRFICWKALPGVRILDSHVLNVKSPRIYPRKFVMRHYKIRSYEHGLRKVFEERLPRFFNQPQDWHVHYNKFKREKKYFVIDPKKLTRYDGDGKWNMERKFDGWQEPLGR